MPIYEYRCKACEHETEALQKMSDKPLRKCPECGKMQLQRLISAPVFRLKGAGWYETDFKSDKENKRNIAGERADSGGAEKKGDAKSGGDKPAKKKESSGSSEAGKKPGKKDSSSAVV